MQSVKKWQYYFIIEVIGLFLNMKGKFFQCQVLKLCSTTSYCLIDLLACSVFHHATQKIMRRLMNLLNLGDTTSA